MPSHLTRVKSKLFVRSRRRMTRALEGEYASRAQGRSFEFDDLRTYVAGDPIRDIDWKATARHGSPLVTRHRAVRQRTLALICDTSRTMNAVTPDGSAKADVAVLAAGVMGYLALRHDDRVALVFGDSDGVRRGGAAETERKLEVLLETAHRAMDPDAGAEDLPALLDFATDRWPREAIAVVVTGDAEPTEALAAALARLGRSRDTLWICVADANPVRAMAASVAVDARDGFALPRHLRNDTPLADQYDAMAAATWDAMTDALDAARVSRCRIEGDAHAIAGILDMLRRRPYAR